MDVVEKYNVLMRKRKKDETKYGMHDTGKNKIPGPLLQHQKKRENMSLEVQGSWVHIWLRSTASRTWPLVAD